MTGIIKAAMEDHYSGLVDNEGTHDVDEFQRLEGELRDEAIALSTGSQIESVLRKKINNGEVLTDEEIYIAVETIGNLYSNLGSEPFKGFGFETYAGDKLSQAEKSRIALEAITNQNADRFKTWKAKFERFGHGMRDALSTLNGSLSSL